MLAASGAELFVGRSLQPEQLGLEVVLDRVVEVRPRTDLIARIFRMNLRS